MRLQTIKNVALTKISTHQSTLFWIIELACSASPRYSAHRQRLWTRFFVLRYPSLGSRFRTIAAKRHLPLSGEKSTSADPQHAHAHPHFRSGPAHSGREGGACDQHVWRFVRVCFSFFGPMISDTAAMENILYVAPPAVFSHRSDIPNHEHAKAV